MAEQTAEDITSTEFADWANMRLTKEVVKSIIDIRDNLTNYIAAGNTLGAEAAFTTDRIVGRIEGITELFNLFEEVKESNKEVPDYGH